MFKNRAHAARLLTQQLNGELNRLHASLEPAYIIGICNEGSMIIAKEVAQHVDVPLILMATEIIPSALEGESHSGAVSSHGVIAWEAKAAKGIAGEHSHLGFLARTAVQKAVDSEQRWRDKVGYQHWPKLKDKHVILIQDDVLCTAKPRAALWTLQNAGVSRVVLATPIILKNVKEGLRKEFALIVSLLVPEAIAEVKDVYEDQHEIEDFAWLSAMDTRSSRA